MSTIAACKELIKWMIYQKGSQLEEELKLLLKTKEEQVAAEAYDQAAVTKEQIEQLQGMLNNVDK